MVIYIEKEYMSCGEKKVEIFIRVTGKFFNPEDQSKYGYVLKKISVRQISTAFLCSLRLSTTLRNFVDIILKSTIIRDQNEASISFFFLRRMQRSF